MSEAERYSITVRRVTLDGENLWRATVRELPDVAEFATSREEAMALAQDTVETLMKAAQAEGRTFPAPAEDDEEFSGRVTLRMPPTLHRNLAEMAESEATSLNQYIVLLLASNASSVLTRQQVLKTVTTQGQQAYAVSRFKDFAKGTITANTGGFPKHMQFIDFTRDFLDNMVDIFEVKGRVAQSAAVAVDLAMLKANEPLLPSVTKKIAKRGKVYGTK